MRTVDAMAAHPYPAAAPAMVHDLPVPVTFVGRLVSTVQGGGIASAPQNFCYPPIVAIRVERNARRKNGEFILKGTSSGCCRITGLQKRKQVELAVNSMNANADLTCDVERRRAALRVAFAILLVGGVPARATAADAIRQWSARSAAGLYQISLGPENKDIPISRLHRWRLILQDAKGTPVSGARIRIDGGMREHGHGLPSRPEIAETARPGEYRIEGVRFNMPGKWQLVVDILAAAGEDRAEFEFSLDI